MFSLSFDQILPIDLAMKIFNIFRKVEKCKLSPVRTLGSAICRCFTVYYYTLFALLTFSSIKIQNVGGAGLYALNESALRRYLEHVLELGEMSDRSLTGERPPHYVQELYDTLADENDRYGRGYVPYEDGLFTVQAVTQDYKGTGTGTGRITITYIFSQSLAHLIGSFKE
uniref:Uncharacterized protein n=1 Tax=Romanomermis culicivorax TaxID=13658 RepID=A0A915I9P8_ROMCU